MNTNSEDKATVPVKKQSLLLSVLNVIIFTYSGVLLLLFVALSIKFRWVASVLNDYFPERSFGNTTVLLFFLGGILLFGLTFWSALLMWKAKRKGFVLYIMVSVITVFILVFSGYGYIPEYIVFSGLILMVYYYYFKQKKTK